MSNSKLVQQAVDKIEPSVEKGEQATQIIEPPLDIGSKLPSFAELLPDQALPYWQLIQQYPALEGLIIFGFFWAFAYFIRRYAIRLIERLAGKTQTNLDDEIISDLRSPIFSTVLWVGLIMSTKAAGIVYGPAKYITPIVLSLIVLSLTKAALTVSGKIITEFSRNDMHFKIFDMGTEPLFIIGSKILLLILGAYLILVIWGINPVGLLASAGIVGIALGFAAKDTLANLFSGVFILADRPYKLGDYVNLDSGERGKVTHIGIRSTRLLTRDDIEVTIPNGVIGNAKVVNESGGFEQQMRIRLDVQCAYDADLEQVSEVLMKVAENETDLCKFPSPRVRVRGFAESGISVQLMGWIDAPEDRGRVTHLMYMAIHEAFREHNLEIPYPRRDIQINREPSDDHEPSAD
ncbi:MAG: MscS family membrane protein [Cryomorphaceae bacterium]|jgi:MscS family membrane protein